MFASCALVSETTPQQIRPLYLAFVSSSEKSQEINEYLYLINEPDSPSLSAQMLIVRTDGFKASIQKAPGASPSAIHSLTRCLLSVRWNTNRFTSGTLRTECGALSHSPQTVCHRGPGLRFIRQAAKLQWKMSQTLQ